MDENTRTEITVSPPVVGGDHFNPHALFELFFFWKGWRVTNEAGEKRVEWRVKVKANGTGERLYHFLLRPLHAIQLPTFCPEKGWSMVNRTATEMAVSTLTPHSVPYFFVLREVTHNERNRN